MMFSRKLTSNFRLLPLTFRKLEYFATPTEFSAKHIYSPEWCALADSIVNILFLRFILPVTTPSKFFNLRPLKVQEIFNGRSPFETKQVIDTTSSALITSSKENGWICGGTAKILQFYCSQIFGRRE